MTERTTKQMSPERVSEQSDDPAMKAAKRYVPPSVLGWVRDLWRNALAETIREEYAPLMAEVERLRWIAGGAYVPARDLNIAKRELDALRGANARLEGEVARLTAGRRIDGKFHISGAQIVKTSSGEVVPEDEPLILMRGRDRLTLPTLQHYKKLCELDGCTDYQLAMVDERIKEFESYAADPSRMKQPGVTRGAAWNPATPPAAQPSEPEHVFDEGVPSKPIERCAARNYPHDHVLCCDNPRCVRDADHGGHCRDAEGRQDPLMPEQATEPPECPCCPDGCRDPHEFDRYGYGATTCVKHQFCHSEYRDRALKKIEEARVNAFADGQANGFKMAEAKLEMPDAWRRHPGLLAQKVGTMVTFFAAAAAPRFVVTPEVRESVVRYVRDELFDADGNVLDWDVCVKHADGLLTILGATVSAENGAPCSPSNPCKGHPSGTVPPHCKIGHLISDWTDSRCPTCDAGDGGRDVK